MAADFGELILLCADPSIPTTSLCIPAQFQTLLVPNRMQHCMCLGTVGSNTTQQYIQSLASNVHFIQGSKQQYLIDPSIPPTKSTQLSDTHTYKYGNFTLTAVEGSSVVPQDNMDALMNVLYREGSDILVTNNGSTSSSSVIEVDGKLVISLGSMTNHYGVKALESVQSSYTPSFVLMAIKGSKCIAYIYELVDGAVSVSKIQYSKQ